MKCVYISLSYEVCSDYNIMVFNFNDVYCLLSLEVCQTFNSLLMKCVRTILYVPSLHSGQGFLGKSKLIMY